MTRYRRVPFLTFLLSPTRRAYINLSGCNFDGKACFAIAKKEVGKALPVEELLNLFTKSGQFIWGENVEEIAITGGEPTLDVNYLIALTQGLKRLPVSKIELSTNGYLLDKELVEELRSLKIDLIKLDLKAYSDEVHRWYTGRSNARVLRAIELVHKYSLNFRVRTIFIPNIVDIDEIEKIAKFLSYIDRGIQYKIYQFSPEHASSDISRRPTPEEMQKSFDVAKRHLDKVESFITTDVSKPGYKYVEVRANELSDEFQKIDERSRSILKTWAMRHVSMEQILSSN